MNYLTNNLWISPSKKITDTLSKFHKGFNLISKLNCKFYETNYIDVYCNVEKEIQIGDTNHMYIASRAYDYKVTVDKNISYIIIQSETFYESSDKKTMDNKTSDEKTSDMYTYMIVFYYLPHMTIDFNFDYHRWIWGETEPGLILIPNLDNDPIYHVKFNFKKMITMIPQEIMTLIPKEIKNNQLNSTHYIDSNISFKFYLDVRYPISIYKTSDMSLVLGENLDSHDYGHDHDYIDISEVLDTSESYSISCNDMISRKTQPIIRVMIGVYKNDKLLYSDYIIFRIAPALLTPNNLQTQTVYLASVDGVYPNKLFIEETCQILNKEGYQSIIIKSDKVSMYHRWMQDILKFVYCSDNNQTNTIVLKGPHFLKHSDGKSSIDYIHSYFKDYHLYDFFYDNDNNLNAFGNVQIMPPIMPKYPFGRIIYGTSTNPIQPNISFHLVDFLESQQVQKPIQVETGWLSVGHVDEILSYVPDPLHPRGFRILIASPRRFHQLISNIDHNNVIFDNDDNYYMFDKQNNEINKRFDPKYENKNQCLYKSQLKVSDILNWEELLKDNAEYQRKLDMVRLILMKELNMGYGEFYEIPIYYWPKSIYPKARSVIPNMINNLFLGKIMLVPKPFVGTGTTLDGECLFEKYFLEQVPKSTKVYFIKNWDSYYLLEGDINCGTNAKRENFKQKWWTIIPEGSYNI